MITFSRYYIRDLFLQFEGYFQQMGWSTDPKQLSPLQGIVWIRSLGNAPDVSQALLSPYFVTVYNRKFSRSSHPIALFLRHDNTMRLITLPKFDPILFQHLFDLCLSASKKYATNPRGYEELRSLPESIDDRSSLSRRFLTNITNCFRLTLVVEFYSWLSAEFPTSDLYNPYRLLDVLEDYKTYLKENSTYGTYINKRKYLGHVCRFLREEVIQMPKAVQLNETSLKLITEFMQMKESGIVITADGREVSDTVWSGQTTLVNVSTLKTYLVRSFALRNLPSEESLALTPYSMKLSDFLAYKAHFPVSKKQLDIIRQFAAFLLDKNPPEEYRNGLRELINKLPKKPPKMAYGRKIEIGRNWISRRDYLILIHTALTSGHLKTRLRNAILIIALGFFALRRSEAMLLQVGDFVLDEAGLLADMTSGYGMLIFPAWKSKGSYCPSIGPYHIPVVPRVRELINRYLKSEFMNGYSSATFLFQTCPVSEQDDALLGSFNDSFSVTGAWVKALADRGKDIVAQIVSIAIPLLETPIKGTLSSHDLRRSIDDFIVKVCLPISALTVCRVAEIHLRHSVSRGTNVDHYQSKPSREEHIACIEKGLDFPWDLDQLKEWEAKNTVKLRHQDNGKVNGVSRYPSAQDAISDLTGQPHPHYNRLEVDALTQHHVNYREKRIRELKQQIEELQNQLKSKSANRIILMPKLQKTQTELEELMKER